MGAALAIIASGVLHFIISCLFVASHVRQREMTPLSIGISVVVNSATYLTRLAGMPSEEDAREARAPAAIFIADARRQAACTASLSLMRRFISAHPAASEGI